MWHQNLADDFTGKDYVLMHFNIYYFYPVLVWLPKTCLFLGFQIVASSLGQTWIFVFFLFLPLNSAFISPAKFIYSFQLRIVIFPEVLPQHGPFSFVIQEDKNVCSACQWLGSGTCSFNESRLPWQSQSLCYTYLGIWKWDTYTYLCLYRAF